MRFLPAVGLCLTVFAATVCADDPFRDQVQPFLKSYCFECHNAKKHEAELNLTRYDSAGALAEDFRQWEHVVGFLSSEEMPPEDAKQPPAQERAKIVKLIGQVMQAEAKKLAGDPGVVLPRRLSNAEYNYTIRDLTGVDIRPAESFPVDPASGEGFSNTGEALLMSPSLFKKYYAAAQQVADHVDFTPSGWRFAPHAAATYADQKELHELAILKFYAAHDVKLEAYLNAAWLYKHRPAADRAPSLENWARQRGLSPKYFASVWKLLEGDTSPKFVIAWLRERWQSLPLPKDAANPQPPGEIQALAGEIRQLSKLLCPKETEAIIANAGNGPIQHIDRRTKTANERDKFNDKLLDDLPALAEKLNTIAQKAVLSADESDREGITTSCAAFCAVFPNRFYYVDDERGLSAGFHLIEGFFRDDRPLCKHVLSDEENKELDRLWNELDFGTHIAEKELRGFVFFERSERNFMKHPDFDSFKEEDPELVREETVLRLEETYFKRSGGKVKEEERETHPIHTFFADIRKGLKQRDEQLAAAAPGYLQQLETFAESAWRRPLSERETQQLRDFYHKLSKQPEFGIEQAVRASIIRLLVSPHFCYRIDAPPPGESVQPLSDLALASRLSYFLWGAQPDAELLASAKAGKLHDEAELLAQTRRMLKDDKVQGFALEFLGQWLRYHDFREQESINREVFRDFDEPLKQAMFEEPTRLTALLIQQNKPITDLLTSDVTVVNPRLARHYGLPFPKVDRLPNEFGAMFAEREAKIWREVSGLHALGRGGLFGMAVFLTKNSQPQRTSPVKRGFWVVHELLGEHIPPPPPDIKVLPAKETETGGKTIRELLALHVEDGKCARCHVRFDAVGLAMEGFDPIGRTRTKDLAGRAIDNVVKLPSGQEARGIPEFSQYLAAERADDFRKTFCRKFLGFALGRSLLLSDQPLLDTMHQTMKNNDDRFVPLFEVVVASDQFRNQRCRDFSTAAFRK
jgi:hypothetical protein